MYERCGGVMKGDGGRLGLCEECKVVDVQSEGGRRERVRKAAGRRPGWLAGWLAPGREGRAEAKRRVDAALGQVLLAGSLCDALVGSQPTEGREKRTTVC